MILIGVGANLPSAYGAPAATFAAALAMLAAHGVRLVRASPLYRSAAEQTHGPRWSRFGRGQAAYHNAVWQVATKLAPRGLLQLLHAIEAQCGRGVRTRPIHAKNRSRPLDLDILAWGKLCQRGPPLLPHPACHRRGFVLYPLRDIAPGWHHPASHEPVAQLLAALPALARPERLGAKERLAICAARA